MATTLHISITNKLGSNVQFSTQYANGIVARTGRCVLTLNGVEADIDIDDLLNAAYALEGTHGND